MDVYRNLLRSSQQPHCRKKKGYARESRDTESAFPRPKLLPSLVSSSRIHLSKSYLPFSSNFVFLLTILFLLSFPLPPRGYAETKKVLHTFKQSSGGPGGI